MIGDPESWPRPGEFHAFETAMIGCLNNWQRVESGLFMVFWHLSLYDSIQLPSLIFTHIRAFDQRRVLVDKMAHAILPQGPELDEWIALNKRLTEAGNKRDRIVHYSIAFPPERKRKPTIEPPHFDYDRRYGRRRVDPTDKEHFLDTKKLNQTMSLFTALLLSLQDFEKRIEPICGKAQKYLAEAILRR